LRIEMNILLLLVSVFILGANSFPQAETRCGVDSSGVSRQPGDSWKEDCNRCRCLTAGIPGCTKKFCGDFSSILEQQEKVCKDSLGDERDEGEKWKDGNDVCSCGRGVVVCTALIAITDVRKDSPLAAIAGGVNFPGSSQQVRGDAVTCSDGACVNMELDVQSAQPLFSLDLSKDVRNTVQCKQAGVQNCRAVNINLDYLETSVNPGDSVNLLAGTGVSMKLRRAPSGSPSGTQSYSFSLSDGGEATITVRPNKGLAVGPSVFGSIKPVTGSVIYSVESCGQGCNVIYERDIGYFNQWED